MRKEGKRMRPTNHKVFTLKEGLLELISVLEGENCNLYIYESVLDSSKYVGVSYEDLETYERFDFELKPLTNSGEDLELLENLALLVTKNKHFSKKYAENWTKSNG